MAVTGSAAALVVTAAVHAAVASSSFVTVNVPVAMLRLLRRKRKAARTVRSSDVPAPVPEPMSRASMESATLDISKREVCVIVPTVNPRTVTPHTESFQALVWHLLVSHPLLRAASNKWESTR